LFVFQNYQGDEGLYNVGKQFQNAACFT